MVTSFDMCRSKLIETVRRIVAESGNPENFDAASWVDRWLAEPLPALGEVPRGYLLAGNNCDRLINLLLRAQLGSYG